MKEPGGHPARISCEERQKRSDRVCLIVLTANGMLAALKMAAGVLGRSGAMISDAVHSLADLGTTLIAAVGIRFAAKARDEDHPYGHERIESVTGLVLSFILAVTALGIGWKGITALAAGASDADVPGTIALVVAGISILTQDFLFRMSRKLARAIDSPALMADAWHHRSDAVSSVGTLIGIGAAKLGLWFMDPVASLLICGLIGKAALSIGKESIDQLVDKAASPDELAEMRRSVLATQGVQRLDVMRSRMHGGRLYLDLEIGVEKQESFEAAHAICEAVHDMLEDRYPKVLHCTVLANPCDPQSPRRDGCHASRAAERA